MMSRVRFAAGFAGCLVALVCGTSVHAKDDPTRADIAEMEAMVATSYIVDQLNLTPDQKQELLSVRKQLAPAAAKYLEHRQAWRKSTAKAVEDFVEFTTRTGEFPPEDIQSKLGEYDGGWHDMRRDFRQAVGPVAARFGGLLTADQTQCLKEIEEHKKRYPGADYVFTGFPLELLTETDAPEWRRLAASTQNARIVALTRAAYLCSAPYVEEALGEEGSGFPHWWDMREEAVQCKRLGTTGNLTFLIGINPSDEQLGAIAKILRKYCPRAGCVDAYAEDLGTAEGRKYAKLLQRAVKGVKSGKQVDRDTMRELHDAQVAWQTNQGEYRNFAKKTEAEQAIVEGIWEVLSTSQIARIAVTDDCPIPSQNVKGISRAGQVASDQLGKIGQLLDSVRRAENWGTPPGDEWWQQKVQWLLGGAKVCDRMGPEQREAAQQKAAAVAEQVRVMSTDEYIAKREEICAELLTLDPRNGKINYVRREVESEEGQKRVVEGKIRWFFISNATSMLALVEARLEQVDGASGSGRRR